MGVWLGWPISDARPLTGHQRGTPPGSSHMPFDERSDLRVNAPPQVGGWVPPIVISQTETVFKSKCTPNVVDADLSSAGVHLSLNGPPT